MSKRDPKSPVNGGRRRPVAIAVIARGEPYVWLTGGALVLAVAMIAGLLGLIFVQGFSTFWPGEIVLVTSHDGKMTMGEVARSASYELTPEQSEALTAKQRSALGGEASSRRRLIRSGNFDLTSTHFTWISDFEVAAEERPEWALLLERREWGRFYGLPTKFIIDDQVAATGAEESWRRYEEFGDDVRDRFAEAEGLKKHELGRISADREEARLDLRRAELADGKDSENYRNASSSLASVEEGAIEQEAEIFKKIEQLELENTRYRLVLTTASGEQQEIPLSQIVRAVPANRLSFFGKVSSYVSRWREFLFDDPREANSEGGVFPAIFGTIIMTLLMTLVVVPFGVLAALYMREYAKAGFLTSAVRIAVNNLAGVPSIVFGVFGLGFFCYIVGASIDDIFYPEYAPNPKFRTGGVLWASLTLALLTLPVVIVTTEEALAAVPSSMREGSYACGASKWQTIRRIVLPRAMPGIMTGAILAMARGAGEVAPLMLVGAVKLAPELPVDGIFPYLHAERSFMHLGFHIFDLSFQSQNSEAAIPMVYTTTLLLIAIIALLNVSAIAIRSRLKRKFVGGQF